MTDEKGEALPGVTRDCERNSTGNGYRHGWKIFIDIAEEKKIIFWFSPWSVWRRKEVVVGKQTGINVVMKDVVSELDDVIVTGYYTQAKIVLPGLPVRSRRRNCNRVEIRIS